MKRTPILAAAIGAAVVLGAGGTALAATSDGSPSSRATDDDRGFRGDGTVDDSVGSTSVTEGSPSPRATDDDHGLRGDGTVDDSVSSSSASRSVSRPGSGSVSPSGSVWPSARSGFGDAVSATDAEGLALAASGGGRVIRVEAETEHSLAVWNVRVVVNGNRYDVDVARGTGQVLPHGHGADDGGLGDRHGDDDGRHGGDRR